MIHDCTPRCVIPYRERVFEKRETPRVPHRLPEPRPQPPRNQDKTVFYIFVLVVGLWLFLRT